MRTALRNIGLRLWQYGQNTGSLVQKQLRAYIPQQLKEARLISSLLQGTRTKLFCFEFAVFCKQKYMVHDHFHGNGQFCKIPTKQEPIVALGFSLGLLCHIVKDFITFVRGEVLKGEFIQFIFILLRTQILRRICFMKYHNHKICYQSFKCTSDL